MSDSLALPATPLPRFRVFAPTLEAKVAGQKELKAREGQRNLKRRFLFDALGELDGQRGS